ncbi:MAG: SMP-30/gluconolactonase/LRE family protein [Alphaproteobacteria bacterium]|nr:SMP-30/gluconolactonase/LRE family protein [Alphaproteobacteria bacterium]
MTDPQTGSRDASLSILTDGLQFPEGPVAMADGAVCLVEIQRQTITRVSPEGRRDILAEVPGGPNGMAVGPDGAFYVCNNGGFLFRKTNGFTRTRPGVPEGYTGGSIDRVSRDGKSIEVLYDRCGEHRLTGPNDIVFDDQGGFYFTDFGKLYDRHRTLGGLYYAQADGSGIVEVAYPMLQPNGVGLSPDFRTVYVAETETGRLWAFDLAGAGVAVKAPFPSPHGGRLLSTLPAYQRLDSMAVEADGNICVATLMSGVITVFSPGGEVLEQVRTGDPITTNICFAGPDMRTAYVTLSGSGRLAAMDWPRPGLKPFHNA